VALKHLLVSDGDVSLWFFEIKRKFLDIELTEKRWAPKTQEL